MGKKSAPKPPDPYKTAMTQTAMNQSTAAYEQLMNMVNQAGPDGGLTYAQSGTFDFYDPVTGKTKKVPRYTATQTLSPEQQTIKGQVDAGQLNLASILKTMSGKLGDTLGTPVDLSSENVKKYMDTHFLDDFDSDWKLQEADLDTKLANQGIGPGSDAHTRAVDDFMRSRSSARNRAYGDRYDAATNALLTERNQPLREIAALLGGTQIDQPNIINTPGANIADTDFAGLTQANYQAKLDAWKQKQDGFSKMLGGLFGIGAAAAGNPEIFSDRRLKTDVKKVGKTDDGQNIYAYRYKGDRAMHLGLMAQEVEKKTPEAVVNVGGYKAVDYAKALHLGAA